MADELSPVDYGGTSLYCTRLHCWLEPGTGLLIRKVGARDDEWEEHRGVLLNANENGAAKMQVFCQREESNLSLDLPIMNGVAFDCNEAIITDEEVDFHGDDVLNIVFFLTLSFVKYNGVVLQGQTNSYIVRYNDKLELIDETTGFLNFPCEHKIWQGKLPSFSRRMFNFTEDVKNAGTQILCRASENQIYRGSKVVFLSPEFIPYLNNFLTITDRAGQKEEIINNCTVRTKKKILLGPASATSCFKVQESTLYRFQRSRHVEAYCKIFGAFGQVGVRTQFPTRKNFDDGVLYYKLSENQGLNVVIGSDAKELPKFRIFPYEQGIDLNVSRQNNFARLTIRYTLRRYSSRHAAKLPKFVRLLLNVQVEAAAEAMERKEVEDDTLREIVSQDRRFRFEGELYRVNEVDHVLQIAFCEKMVPRIWCDPDEENGGEPVEMKRFSLQRVKQFVSDYYAVPIKKSPARTNNQETR